MRILLILDGSVPALEEALRLVRERGAELSALFVTDDGWRGYTGNDWLSTSRSYTGFLEWMEGQEDQEARRVMDDFLGRAKAQGIEPRLKLARGKVSQEALKELEHGYDLLVMGHPLRRGLESMRDATAQIVKHAPCSLMLVKDDRDPA